MTRCSAGELRPNTYQGVKDTSAYLRSMNVSRAQRKQIIDSFDLETISVHKAGNNQFGTRFHDYGKIAGAQELPPIFCSIRGIMNGHRIEVFGESLLNNLFILGLK